MTVERIAHHAGDYSKVPIYDFDMGPIGFFLPNMVNSKVNELVDTSKQDGTQTTRTELTAALLLTLSGVDGDKVQNDIMDYREATRYDAGKKVSFRWPRLVTQKLDVLVSSARRVRAQRAEFLGHAVLHSPDEPEALSKIVKAYREIEVGGFDPGSVAPAIDVTSPA